MEGLLILENGSIYEGEFLVKPPSDKAICGEVVFNTSMTGYQEILTDPSYFGQIITFTYPLIGNYGTDNLFNESSKVHASGAIFNQGFQEKIESGGIITFLKEKNVPVLAGIDTRKLVKEIRKHGTLKGYMVSKETFVTLEVLKKSIITHKTNFGYIPGTEVAEVKEVASVSTKEIYKLSCENPQYHVVMIDYGFKANIAKELLKRDCEVTVVPYDTDGETILTLNPDGILLSNGPGDPKSILKETSGIKELFGKVPIMGICLGHQLLALHLGGDTFKLKYGHRGGNHPVQEVKTKKVWITSQNHGYSVNPYSLPKDIEITHINLNDNTVEGIRHKKYPIFSIQFHPEASPGPKEGEVFFDNFIEAMDKGAYGYEKLRA